MASRLEAIARGVNRILERAAENRIFSTHPNPEFKRTIVKKLEDGSIITVDVLTQRDFGSFTENGVYITVSEKSDKGTNQDTFYSLDETGDNFWHIQSTPFLGEVLETRDTSLERLIPYQKEVVEALSHSRKAKRIMQTGFDHLQTL